MTLAGPAKRRGVKYFLAGPAQRRGAESQPDIWLAIDTPAYALKPAILQATSHKMYYRAVITKTAVSPSGVDLAVAPESRRLQ